MDIKDVIKRLRNNDLTFLSAQSDEIEQKINRDWGDLISSI